MHLRYTRIFYLLFFWLCHPHIAAAQTAVSTDSTVFAYRISVMQRSEITSNTPYLVHFKHTPTAALLQQQGFLRIIKPGYYILQNARFDSAQLLNVASIDTANARWKTSNSLLQVMLHAKSTDSITILLAADVLPLPAKPIQEGIYRMRMQLKDIDYLLSKPNVHFADIPKKGVPDMIINTSDMRLNRIVLLQQHYPQLQGQDAVISFKESMFDTSDIDLLGKDIPSGIEAAHSSEHASIMATLAAGRGNSGETGKGVAPLAKLSGADYSESLMPDADDYYTQFKIGVQNHSYGTPSVENYYGIEAVAFDTQAWAQDTLLHVFSSGNIGDSSSPDGAYAGATGFANLSGNFKQAKNVLIVGGTDASNNMPLLSSKGPAYDGRVKPDIVAYGEDGTSGSAALSSGVSALLQQAYRQQQGHLPSTALLRGLLINNADDIGNAQVDYASGFGALNAAAAMLCLQEKHFFNSTANDNATTTIPLTVPAGMGQLKVTLTWNDPPASVNAPQALINDLDLQIATPEGNIVLPWVLQPQTALLNALAQRGRDSLNNTEQVTIDNPATGVYMLHVKGFHIPKGPQTFYLVYTWTPAQAFTWEYPIRSSKLEAATSVPLHWTAYGYSSGNISYSLDRGITWTALASAITLRPDRFAWALPDTFCTGLLKMETNGQTFISDTFVISPRPTLHAGFDCSDAAQLWWNAQAGAESYALSAINGDSLTPYSHVRDTTIIVPNDAVNSFSLRAISARGDTGMQSLTYNYHNQGLQCYIQTLLADTLSQGVLLQLQLGTTYHLQSIRWERQQGNKFITLNTQPIGDGLNYAFTDTTTLTGITYYRVELVADDGKIYTSDLVAVNLLGSHLFLVFPNPVQTQLQVFSHSTDNILLHLYDLQGRLVAAHTITDPQQSFYVGNINAGMYFCVLYEKGKVVFKQKVIVLGGK